MTRSSHTSPNTFANRNPGAIPVDHHRKRDSVKTPDIVALPLQLGSALRHRRVFHPLGVLAAGRIERIAPADVGLPVESADILGRVSKAVGTPGGLPDLIGLAWRMPPRASAATPWDVLMVSAGSGLLTRCTLRPTLSWTGTTLSTLMPLRRADGWWWVKAEMTTPIGGRLSLDALRDRISTGGIVFDVQQAHGTGSFERLAELVLTAVIPTDEDHDVSFDPTRNSTPGVGLGPEWLTTLRERAYLRSRRGRHATSTSNP
jgi:hypothetical protein